MKKYICSICGYIYEETAGIPSGGIAAGTKWEELPGDWVCPLCGAAKSEFKEQADEPEAGEAQVPMEELEGDLREMTVGELSALCSNLAKGCEKQYLPEESALFTRLSEYFKSKTPNEAQPDISGLLKLVQQNLEQGFTAANSAAGAKEDRGAKRALVWSEKVTRILNSLLARYEKEGDGFIRNTNVYVCEICGFVYVGDNPPELCPVCKVPGWKFAQIERRA